MPKSPSDRALAIAPMLALALAGPLAGQEAMSQTDDFDPGRAILNDEPRFDPFRPTALEPLEDAVKDGRLKDDTPVMVLERKGRHLALSTMQMSYHHVAQGELAGEPWMVSF